MNSDSTGTAFQLSHLPGLGVHRVSPRVCSVVEPADGLLPAGHQHDLAKDGPHFGRCRFQLLDEVSLREVLGDDDVVARPQVQHRRRPRDLTGQPSGLGRAVLPAADQTTEEVHIEVERQGMLVDVHPGESGLAAARGSVQQEQDRHRVNLRRNSSRHRCAQARSAAPGVLWKSPSGHRPLTAPHSNTRRRSLKKLERL
jgi:hypothetical protein